MQLCSRVIRLSTILVLAALGGTAVAQQQFIFEPGVTTGFAAVEKGQYSLPTISDSLASPTGKRVYFYAHGAYEFPVDCNTPGLYAVSLNQFVSSADYVTLSFSARAEAATTDPYATRYTSRDTAPLPYTGEGAYFDFPSVTDVDGNVIALPLVSGRNIIRVQNVTGLHQPANVYPTDVTATDNRPAFTGANTGFSVSQARVTLDRVGSLPPYGTVTGIVTGDKPANTPVSGAIVTANAPGQSTTEINTWWKSGYWTTTRSNGRYTLTAPTGSQDIKAGRPSTYQVEGSGVVTVSVQTTSAAMADLSLTSMWHDDGTGHPTISVQAEYFDSHVGGVGFYHWDTHQNTFGILGYNGPATGLSLSYVVDAPQSGLYRATQAWNWGRGDTNHTRLSTNLGSSTEMDLPNNKWAIQTKDYPEPIYLAAGRNVITTTVVSGDVGWDGLQLTLTDQTPNFGTVQGTVTDSVSGQPVAGATVTIGDKTYSTDSTGKYQALLGPGAYTGSVSAAFADAPVPFSFSISTADIASGTPVVRDISITIRPNMTLTSANGFAWKGVVNTGGTVDYSAVGADESAFTDATIPGTWSSMGEPEQIYGWYRLHFDVPATFITGIPNRMAVLRVSTRNFIGISEVDKMWVNGTPIGQTGLFPNTPLDVQPEGHLQPRAGDGGLGYYMYPPGLMTAAEESRAYYFPTSLLHAGSNVLAVKIFNNGSNDWIARPGGIVGIPSLEIAGPTGVVTGAVKSGGAGVPGVRVSALDSNAIATDWAMTDASGNYTLTHTPVGSVRLGAAKPGYEAKSLSAGTLANAQTLGGANIDLPAVSGGPAPVYDEFTATDWPARWLAQSIDGANGADPTLAPIITIPGFDPNTVATIPGTVTIENTQSGGATGDAQGHWGALISKERFSRWASVTAGKMVGLKDGTELDLFLLGSSAADTTTLTTRNLVGFDIRGTLGSLYQASVNDEPRLLWWIRNTDSPAEHASMGAVPGAFASPLDITPANPIEFAFTRTGSFWDLYLNGQRVWGGNLPMTNFGDHRISASTWTTPSGQTWDWFRAGPVAAPARGDLSGNGQLDQADAVIALRIAGGLQAATTADIAVGNVTGNAAIGLDDAVRLLQGANGSPLP